MRLRFLYVLRIAKFALPLAAVVCFSALAPVAQAEAKRSSRSKNRTSESSTRKKSSAKKKSAKSKSRTAKSKQKTKSRSEEVASNEWIENLPEVELPEAPGPAEDELLEPLPEPALAP